MEQESLSRREEPAAFDLWMRRVLRDRYGHVVREPVPEELLSLLRAEPQQG